MQGRGDLQAHLTQHAAALASYAEAIAAYDATPAFAPGDIQALNNKGLALQGLGDLEANQEDAASACAHYQAAVASWAHSLALAPDQQAVRGALATLQQRIDDICTL